MSKDISKVMKKLPDTFAETVDGMKEEELKRLVYECECNIHVINEAKANDEKLTAAKEVSKDLAAPYREAKGVQSAKIEYIMYALENRGVDLEKHSA